jgi:hypothetical protein
MARNEALQFAQDPVEMVSHRYVGRDALNRLGEESSWDAEASAEAAPRFRAQV